MDQVIRLDIEGLDEALGGGVPSLSINIIAGPPGSGKTILMQQIMFNLAKKGARSLYLTTVSEPALKMIRYMQKFDFFDEDLFGKSIEYKDIGRYVSKEGIGGLADEIIRLVRETESEVLVIDSFKAIRDLCSSEEEFRRFTYSLSVYLSVENVTSFLVGEYSQEETRSLSEFAIADGILYLYTEMEGTLSKRYLRVLKLRGAAPCDEPIPFEITGSGCVFFPAKVRLEGVKPKSGVIHLDIPGWDMLLGGPMKRGRSMIISGISGSGKTTLCLQIANHVTQQGNHRTLYMAFEETEEHLIDLAESFGWDLRGKMEKGEIKVISVPQTEVNADAHIGLLLKELSEFKPDVVIVDSLSILLYRVQDEVSRRDKVFQITEGIRKAGAIGFLVTDIPADQSTKLSRFGVEETVVDGVIVLSTEVKGLTRRRYIEVYKLRNARHLSGRHRMSITDNGLEILVPEMLPKYGGEIDRTVHFSPVKGMMEPPPGFGTSWLVKGLHGLGKSVLAYQFAWEGLRNGEYALILSLDVPASITRRNMKELGFDVEEYEKMNRIIIADPSREEELGDIQDPEEFVFYMMKLVGRLGQPLRVVTDSLTPLALGPDSNRFVEMIHRKNLLLRNAGAVIFDLMLDQILSTVEFNRMMGAYDVMIELFYPDWGEMQQQGIGSNAFRIVKSRISKFDNHPYPYTIERGKGVVLHRWFYNQ